MHDTKQYEYVGHFSNGLSTTIIKQKYFQYDVTLNELYM